jgi:hypothetical protein
VARGFLSILQALPVTLEEILSRFLKQNEYGFENMYFWSLKPGLPSFVLKWVHLVHKKDS